MNTIEQMYSASANIEEFSRKYFQYLSQLLDSLDTKAIAALLNALETARQNQQTIYIIGNGGSAATASHLANDLGIGVLQKFESDRPFRVLALTDNIPSMTAIANDTGYQNLFVNQLKTYYRPGDLLIAISASGNSPNIIAAAEWVKARNGKVVGLIGFDGGKLNHLCDIVVWIETPQGEYGPVEDIHLVLDHVLFSWLQYHVGSRAA